MMWFNFILLETNFLLLKQGECLIACVFWKDECETISEELMKKSTHEDDMKITMKKSEKKDGCKDGGSFSEISIPMKNFNDQ